MCNVSWVQALVLYWPQHPLNYYMLLLCQELPRQYARSHFQDHMNHLAPIGPVYQAGTLSGNPLAMSAGIATLTELESSEAFSIADRVAVMANGSIKQVGPPDQIYFWPLTKEVAELGGTCDFLSGTIHGQVAKTSAGPLPLRLTGKYPNGTKIIIAIRPNDLIITPSPNGENTVVRKEFRGDDTIFWVQTPKQEILRCKHKTHTTLFTGLKVTLTPDKYAKFNAFTE